MKTNDSKKKKVDLSTFEANRNEFKEIVQILNTAVKSLKDADSSSSLSLEEFINMYKRGQELIEELNLQLALASEQIEVERTNVDSEK